jgi:hypothetical protein
MDNKITNSPTGLLERIVGMWRSLVARLLGMQEDVGSNPAIPTHARLQDSHG